MLPIDYQYKRFVSQAPGRLLWIFVSFVLVFISSSCYKKEAAENSDYSKDFNAIYHNNRLYDANKADKAMYYLDSAFSQLNRATHNDTFRYYALHFAYDKKVNHNAAKELLYADSMLAVANRCIHEKQYINFFSEANFAKGDAYFDTQQYNDAYKCFYEGYFLGKNHLNNEILSEYTYRMGMISFKQSRFDAAANYFKDSYRQSLSSSVNFASFYQKQELLNDIGESYQKNGDLDSASLYFAKTLAYINENGNNYNNSNLLDVAKAVNYGDQGLMAYQKKQYRQAKNLFKKSIAINLKSFNDNYNAELVEINLAQLYLDLLKKEEFSGLMQDIRHQLDSVKNIEAETDWNKLMSSYSLQKNDYATAFSYFKKYGHLKDSLTKESSSLKGTDVNQQLANYEKQYQIQTLKGYNNLQQVYLYLALISVILAVIIIFLVLRNFKRSKQDVLAISTLNKQINSQKADLEAMLTELKINSQEKDRILRTVAHDLRNPIGGIVSLTNSMLYDDYNDEQKQLIGLVNGTSNNSLELINEILEATNSTKERLNKESVEINALVNNSVEILSFKAKEKNQKIETNLLDKPYNLFINREKVWRVISNLISNAIKFSPDGTIIFVKVTNQNSCINISVTDQGIGIPDDIKDHVFNIFTNAKRPGTAGEKSFGLGLSICQQIIENHNGKIWFENGTPKGTVFYISLPSTQQ